MKLIYEDQIPSNKQAFKQKVIDISRDLGINPNWLMAVMYFETGRTLDPSKQNPSTNATGLIQFMPATAKDLGTSVQELKQMSNVRQLDYVKRYLDRYNHKITRFVDLYLSVFFPAALNQPRDYIIQTDSLRADTVAQQNPIFDLDKDDKITVGEVEEKKLSLIPENWRDEFKKTYDSVLKFAGRNAWEIAAGIVAVVLAGYLYYKTFIK